MGTRRQSRESALKVLYQIELTGQTPSEAISGYWEENDAPREVREFAEELVGGVMSDIAGIDDTIAAHSTNWKISRMAAVDKNILRMAVYELRSCEEIPVKVTINEAVEIAKKFGSIESGAFVNGILDNVAKVIGEADAEERDA